MSRRRLVVTGPDGPRPFMRGILVQSLHSRGIPFDVALETATLLRDRVAARGEVSRGELGKMVEELLSDRLDLEAVPLQPPEEPLQVVTSGRKGSPFSKGLLAISLQGAGLEPSEAFDVAREIEARLLLEGRHQIQRTELRELVRRTIERAHGAGAAERYVVCRRALEDGRPILLLLGGAPGVGKTSIAVEVARRLEISRVLGTDSIRQIMRLMFSDSLMPEIHCSTYDAYRKLLPGGTGSRAVIGGFLEQAQKITVGVHALLDRAVEENTSMMIEGVNLVPSLLDLERYRRDAHVIFAIVATLDAEAYHHRFEVRGAKVRQRDASRYLPHFREIQTIQEYILGEADRADLPIIENVHFDEAVLSVIRSVLATLKKSVVVPVQAVAN